LQIITLFRLLGFFFSKGYCWAALKNQVETLVQFTNLETVAAAAGIQNHIVEKSYYFFSFLTGWAQNLNFSHSLHK